MSLFFQYVVTGVLACVVVTAFAVLAYIAITWSNHLTREDDKVTK